MLRATKEMLCANGPGLGRIDGKYDEKFMAVDNRLLLEELIS